MVVYSHDWSLPILERPAIRWHGYTMQMSFCWQQKRFESFLSNYPAKRPLSLLGLKQNCKNFPHIMVNPIKLQNFSFTQLLLFIVWDYTVYISEDMVENGLHYLFDCDCYYELNKYKDFTKDTQANYFWKISWESILS